MRALAYPLALILIAALGASCKERRPGQGSAAAPATGDAEAEGEAEGEPAGQPAGAAGVGEPWPELQLAMGQARTVLAVLDQRIERMDLTGLLTLGAHCGATPGCVSPECARALRVCRTVPALERCGEFLKAECPPFAREVGSIEGEELRTETEAWIRARYRRMIDTARAALGPSDQDALDRARVRHGL
jgi:hypothetical protein